jgi:hypothetical protein
MKRGLTALVAALFLSLGTAAAASADGGDGGGWGGGSSSDVTVAGTVVSVNTTANSFIANAYEVGQGDSGSGGGSSGGDESGSNGGSGSGGGGGGPSGDFRRAHHDGGSGGGTGGSTPTTTQVTITTNPNTAIQVNGSDATISGLAAGQKFVATFTSQGTDITTLVANNPALSVDAETPPQPYAFVGTVSAVNATAGTVSVNVSSSLPAGLVPSSSNPATFTVDSATLILGGTSTGLSGGLSNVSVGDVVAGGLVATSGETLAQVSATPLRLLIDFPAGTGTGHSTNTKATALNKAAALLGIKTKAKGKGKTKPKKSKSHKPTRK